MSTGLLPVALALRYPESAPALARLADTGPADAERLLRWRLSPPRRLAALRSQGLPSRLVRLAADALIHQCLEVANVSWSPRSRRPAFSIPFPRIRRPRRRSANPAPALLALVDALPPGLHLHAHAGSALLALAGAVPGHPPLAVQSESLHALAHHLAHLHHVLPPFGAAETAFAALPALFKALRASPDMTLPAGGWAVAPGVCAYVAPDGSCVVQGTARAAWPDPLPQRPLPAPPVAYLLDALDGAEIALPPRTPLSSHQRLRIGLCAETVAALQAAAPGPEGRIRIRPLPEAILLLLPGVGRGGPDLLLLPRQELPCAAEPSSQPPPSC